MYMMNGEISDIISRDELLKRLKSLEDNSNSINESSNNQLNKKDKISYAFNYENFRKNLLSTNSTNSPKIMTERFFSSPKKIKNVKLL